MSLVNAFGALALDSSVQDVNDKLVSGVKAKTENLVTALRDSFENFNDGERWNLSLGSGDIVQADGNAVGASYVVISKDPLTAGSTTALTSVNDLNLPIEASVGLSASQRILGQEMAVEFVSTQTPLSPFTELDISSISQSTTTLTVNTATAHGLFPGMRIGIYGCSESSLNYPSLVVATIPNPTRFTVTATPVGTLTSNTIAGPANSGKVYVRPALGSAQNGLSQIFENTTITSSAFFVRASGGDAMPSGTLNGAHGVTVSSAASVAAISAIGTYAFVPTSEYRYAIQTDRLQAFDGLIDSALGQTSRLLRTQVVPDTAVPYKMRIRSVNNKALTVPTARILSISKSGSTTCTVNTDVDHGLTTGDLVVINGVATQASFAYSTTPSRVLSVIDSTSFTVAWGNSATATSRGGFVARVQGANVPTSFLAQAAQSVTVASGILTVAGSANWSPLLIGDYVNLHGCIDNSNNLLGLDGAYRVRNVSGSTLELEVVGSTAVPENLVSTPCGGSIIKRSDLRLHFVRVFDFMRQRVEMSTRPDPVNTLPVNVTGGTVTTVSTVTNVNTLATLTAGYLGAPVGTNDQSSGAIAVTTTSSTVTPGAGVTQVIAYFVSAVSGTNPTLDVVVQQSDDSGTNWYDLYHFPCIKAVGQYRSPPLVLRGNRIRYIQTIGGTTPSFTRSITRFQTNVQGPNQAQFFDRTLDLSTLSAITPVWFVDGCTDFNVVVNMGAITTTAPVLALEISPDGTEWMQAGADITTAANTNTLLAVSNTMARFVRLRVKTEGPDAVLGFLMVKGVGK